MKQNGLPGYFLDIFDFSNNKHPLLHTIAGNQQYLPHWEKSGLYYKRNKIRFEWLSDYANYTDSLKDLAKELSAQSEAIVHTDPLIGTLY